jgi:hypothetical protein
LVLLIDSFMKFFVVFLKDLSKGFDSLFSLSIKLLYDTFALVNDILDIGSMFFFEIVYLVVHFLMGLKTHCTKRLKTLAEFFGLFFEFFDRFHLGILLVTFL